MLVGGFLDPKMRALLARFRPSKEAGGLACGGDGGGPEP